jgi:hypothetical protein
LFKAVPTKAVVAICVLFVPADAVGAVGVPVKAGLAFGARLLRVFLIDVPVVWSVPPVYISPLNQAFPFQSRVYAFERAVSLVPFPAI